MSEWATRQANVPIDFVHADLPGRFDFDAPLQDLARRQDVSTAMRQAKGLEYRPPALDWEGESWPWLLMAEPVLVGLSGVLLLFAVQ